MFKIRKILESKAKYYEEVVSGKKMTGSLLNKF